MSAHGAAGHTLRTLAELAKTAAAHGRHDIVDAIHGDIGSLAVRLRRMVRGGSARRHARTGGAQA